MFHSVLTADLVNSTLLEPTREKQVLQSIKSILANHKSEFFRGDSFQVYLPKAEEALKVALLCRTSAIALQPDDSSVRSDVRISIGIGNVEGPVRELATAKGEAFLLSGRAFDNMQKSEGRLIISTEHKLGNTSFSVLSDYINSIYKQMTTKQAEVIFELLKGLSQQQVAEKLNRSKSTISQHVTAGKWDEIENLIDKYQQIVQLISYDN
jgi:hypothetical protein